MFQFEARLATSVKLGTLDWLIVLRDEIVTRSPGSVTKSPGPW